MKQSRMIAVRVGSSDHTGRMKELRENHKRIQEMIDNGWQLKTTKVKRPRIKKEKFKVIITCFGPMKITIEEFNEHCKDFKTLNYE